MAKPGEQGRAAPHFVGLGRATGHELDDLGPLGSAEVDERRADVDPIAVAERGWHSAERGDGVVAVGQGVVVTRQEE